MCVRSRLFPGRKFLLWRFYQCDSTFPVHCRLLWRTQGWCRTCSRSRTPRTCACGRRWGCPRPAVSGAAPGWPCRPRGSPGGRGWDRSWTGPLWPLSALGNSGSERERGIKRSQHGISSLNESFHSYHTAWISLVTLCPSYVQLPRTLHFCLKLALFWVICYWYLWN